jgi:hypothetical protein
LHHFSHNLFNKMAESRESTMPQVTVVSPLRVILLGAMILAIGTAGFHFIPGMIADGAQGTPLVNAFYCAAITLMT